MLAELKNWPINSPPCASVAIHACNATCFHGGIKITSLHDSSEVFPSKQITTDSLQLLLFNKHKKFDE